MNISPDTHILVGDIAYRMKEECEAACKATPAGIGFVRIEGDLASYYVANMLHHVGFNQYLAGISKSLDEVESDFLRRVSPHDM